MKSAYTWMVANVLFPAHELAKRHDSVAVRRSLERSQWLSPPQLAGLQLERLRRLLVHAGGTVPYYRELFSRCDFRPEALQSVGDLGRLPTLSKADIRRAGDSLAASDATGLTKFTTGGSSGEPLVFSIGRNRVSHDIAAKWRATRWWNVDIGDVEVVLWGSPIELGAQDRWRMLRDRVIRSHLHPAFDLSAANVGVLLEKLRTLRPRHLFGYPSAWSLVAREAQRRGMRMDDLGIRVAFVTAERLYPEQREVIGHVFGCKVANGYGSRDAGFIAHECPDGGMHITAEDIVVEIVDAGGKPLPPGEAGEIVVTNLATGDFPFIRYRTGDVGVLSSAACSCGRGLPLLQEVQGRTTDFIVARDGTVMHGLALIYVLRELGGIEAFKIIQESLDRTRVLLVPGAGYTPDHTSRVVAGFRRRLGPEVAVEVELVKEIPAERSGKHRYVISHVAQA